MFCHHHDLHIVLIMVTSNVYWLYDLPLLSTVAVTPSWLIIQHSNTELPLQVLEPELKFHIPTPQGFRIFEKEQIEEFPGRQLKTMGFSGGRELMIVVKQVLMNLNRFQWLRNFSGCMLVIVVSSG